LAPQKQQAPVHVHSNRWFSRFVCGSVHYSRQSVPCRYREAAEAGRVAGQASRRLALPRDIAALLHNLTSTVSVASIDGLITRRCPLSA